MTATASRSKTVVEDSTEPRILFPYGARKARHYLIDESQTITLTPDLLVDATARKVRKILCIPLVVDTEFYTQSWHGFYTGALARRQGVTLQCRGAVGGTPRIFAHPHHALFAERKKRILRHPVALQEPFSTSLHLPPALHTPNGFLGANYLRAEHMQAHLERAPWKFVQSLPVAQFALYGHYLLAELYMMFAGEFLADIDARVRTKEITLGRRLLAAQKRRDNTRQSPAKEQLPPHDYVSLPWILTLNNMQFAVEISFLDTAAFHGPVSFATLCENVGVPLHYKDLVKREWITRMHELYWQDAALFDGYALEDLLVYQALLANDRHMRMMYNALGLGLYTPDEPYPTRGRDSQMVFVAMAHNSLEIPPGKDGKDAHKALLHAMHRATANYLAAHVHTWACLLAKVEGGRCRNNRPHVAYVLGPIADIDIASCYGAGLAHQVYPIGTPVILAPKNDTPYNKYLTLREFRTMIEHELVPGLWHARVTLADDDTLQHPQDFLGSWFDYNQDDQWEQIFPGAEEKDDPIMALTVRSGCLKLLRKQIVDAVITSDFLEWLDNVCTITQRQELSDKLLVKSALFYPKSQEKTSLAALEADRNPDVHTGRNTVRVFSRRNSLLVQTNEEEYHGWVGLSLGKIGVNTLLQLRKKEDKGTPLNTLLKLTINALYGDSVSQYFDTSNMCVGNNITARARAMAWYMEKGLNLIQTITDGGTYELNRVVYPGHSQLNAMNTLDLCRATPTDIHNRLHLRLAPLGGYDRIESDWVENELVLHLWKNGKLQPLRGKDAHQWMDDTALTHLQNVFPHATVLKQFTFETKKNGVYLWGTFHGAANYYLHHADPEQCLVKMRSYEREKEYYTVEYDKNTDRLVPGTFYDGTIPSRKFLPALEHPDSVEPQHVFLKDSIFKDGEYRQRGKDVPFEHTHLVPGDNLYKCGLLRAWNLSQFHYCTIDQFKAIKRQWESFKRRYGWYLEMLFLNADGSLDYQRMIAEVDQAILQGETNLIEYFDPSAHKREALGNRIYHPAYRTLEAARHELAQLQGLGDSAQPAATEYQESHAETSWDHIPYEYAAAD